MGHFVDHGLASGAFSAAIRGAVVGMTLCRRQHRFFLLF